MLQEYLKIELSEKGYEDIINKKTFVFSVEIENTYNFINTMEEDLKVYSYDENEEKIIGTKMNFNTFMIEMIEKYNSKYRPVSEWIFNRKYINRGRQLFKRRNNKRKKRDSFREKRIIFFWNSKTIYFKNK